MKFHIKNMVCSRCKMIVRSELEKQGLHPISVDLGEAEIQETISDTQRADINSNLLKYGFELIDDKKSIVIEKIINRIVELVHYSDEQLKTNFSDDISKRLSHDYSYLSKLFSDVKGTTIEKYFIAQKIEKVKELLVYDERSLSQIADDIGYSSVSHLSKQFKQVTGFTPSQFKQQKGGRTPLEEV